MMLLIPASAVALTSATAQPGQSTQAVGGTAAPLHLRVVPQRLEYGRPVTVTGRAPDADAGRTAVLQTALSRRTSWRPVATTRVGRHGGFRIRAVLRHSGLLRVVDSAYVSTAPVAPTAVAAVGAAVLPASAPRAVRVAARLRVRPRALEVLGGRSVSVSGRLTPGRAGRAVRLEGHSAVGWHRLADARTGSSGRFRMRYAPVSGLQRRLRVVFAGDLANARAAREAGQLTVYGESVASWYNDAGSTACGFHAGFGVANRSLPCGAKVRLRYGGHSVTAVVDDRGPYVGGRDWDLNQNTAAALHFGGVGTIWTTG